MNEHADPQISLAHLFGDLSHSVSKPFFFLFLAEKGEDAGFHFPCFGISPPSLVGRLRPTIDDEVRERKWFVFFRWEVWRRERHLLPLRKLVSGFSIEGLCHTPQRGKAACLKPLTLFLFFKEADT